MTTEEKALALVKAVGAERQRSLYTRTINRRVDTDEALCRSIEQHEAFRQEVSDVVRHYVYADGGPDDWEKLKGLIISKPEPDPLVAAMKKAGWGDAYISNSEPSLRAALDALGFEIREKNDG